MSGILRVVVGGQFGSEAKGRIAGYLTRPEEDPGRQVICVRVGGSNAGHTVYGSCTEAMCGEHTQPGIHPWRLRHMPVAAVTNPEARLVLAAGSEIDRDVLAQEVSCLESAGYKVADRLSVDSEATVIERHHIEQESANASSLVQLIGSTGKGVGAARADRALRRARLWKEVGYPNLLGTVIHNTGVNLRNALEQGASVTIEGVQGYGLGTHAGYYPKVTSSDCRAIDFLAMAGLSPWDPAVERFEVYLVLRTRPIRVAGPSGPLFGETSWEALGLEPEITTVTRKVRRVGVWDSALARWAVDENGGSVVKLCLTMLDQVWPMARGVTDWAELSSLAQNWVRIIEQQLSAKAALLGTGPVSLIDLR